jgi:hypothetical protein
MNFKSLLNSWVILEFSKFAFVLAAVFYLLQGDNPPPW